MASRRTLEAILTAQETVSTALNDIEDSLEEVRRSAIGAAAALRALESVIEGDENAFVKAAFAAELFDEQLDDVGVSGTLSAAQLMGLAAALQTTESSLDDAEDEADELTRALQQLGTGALATSLNIGPFNFALKNLLTTLPILITTVGSLTTALLGLATAVTAVATAFATIFAGGVLVMAEQIAAESSDMENSLEAVQKIMERIGDLFTRALEPLQNQQSVQMFTSTVTGLAEAFGMVVQSIARIQDELAAFQDEFGADFFRLFPEVIREVEITVLEFLPVLADINRWFLRVLPGAIRFFREETLRFLPTLAEFGESLTNFFRVFSEFGVAALGGLLPVLAGVLNLLATVVDLINALPDDVVSLTIGIFALSFALGKFMTIGRSIVGIYTAFAGVMSAAGGGVSGFVFALNQANRSLGLFAAVSVTTAETVSAAALSMGASITAALGPVGAVLLAIVAVGTVLALVFNAMTNDVNELAVIMEFLRNAVMEYVDFALRMWVPAFNAVIEAIEFLIAIGQVVIGVITAIARAFGFLGEGETLLGGIIGLFRVMANVIGAIFRVMGDLFDLMTRALNQIPGVDVDTDTLEGAKITQEQAKAGAAKVVGKATGQKASERRGAKTAVTPGGTTVVDQSTHNEYNFEGDFNMAPEEKARVKTLVEEAIRQANRRNRIQDGGV